MKCLIDLIKRIFKRRSPRKSKAKAKAAAQATKPKPAWLKTVDVGDELLVSPRGLWIRQAHGCELFSSASAAGSLSGVRAPNPRNSAYRTVTSIPSEYLSVNSCRRAPWGSPPASDSSLAVNVEGRRKSVWISPEIEHRIIPARSTDLE